MKILLAAVTVLGVWTTRADAMYEDANGAPDTPNLVTPPDGGTAETLDVELTVAVTDPEADTLSVAYFGRFVPADPFVLVALPDTQHYSQSFPATFQAQTQWIIDNQASMNIAYVAHLGDIVESPGVTRQWLNADVAMSTLDLLPGLAYGFGVGNYDQDPLGDRRTYGTVMAKRVPMHDLKRLMGHSNFATTEAFYLGASDDLSEKVRAAFVA